MRSGPIFASMNDGEEVLVENIQEKEEEFVIEDGQNKRTVFVTKNNKDEVFSISFDEKELSIIKFIKSVLETSKFKDKAVLKFAANKWLIDKIISGEQSLNIEEDLKEIDVFID